MFGFFRKKRIWLVQVAFVIYKEVYKGRYNSRNSFLLGELVKDMTEVEFEEYCYLRDRWADKRLARLIKGRQKT